MTRLAFGVAVCMVLGAVACDWDGLRESDRDNEPPSVRITGGAVEGEQADYRVEFFWFGSDRDGTIDHFLYAIDDTSLCQYPDTIEVFNPVTGTYDQVPITVQGQTVGECLSHGIEPSYTSVDSIWKRTDAYSGIFNFSATTGEPPVSTPYFASDWHTFYVKAVDDRGAMSPPDRRFFNAVTIAPSVKLLAPIGTGEEKSQTVSTFVTLRWEGRDEDSPLPDKKPLGYQMKLVTLSTIFETDGQVLQKIKGATVPPTRNVLIPEEQIVPDSVEVGDDTYHSDDWWPKLSDPYRDEIFRLQNLLNGNYAAGIRAIDLAGAVMPDAALAIAILNNNGNIIKLKVSDQISVNPHLLLSERNFLGSHEFAASGEAPWRVEVPVGVPLEFEWTADASWYGARVGQSNFALDISDPGCEVCQSADGIGGWVGWGSMDRIPFPIVFGEQDAGEEHILYIRVRDESFLPEREVMGAVVMDVVAFPFDRTALWIDDYDASGLTDCVHDAFIEPMLEGAIAPYLEPGEDLGRWGLVRLPSCAEASEEPDPLLSILGRYKLLYWNTVGRRSPSSGASSIAGLSSDPMDGAEFGKNLAIYVRAGGNVIFWGKNVTAALLGDFFPDQSYDPELPAYSAPNFGPGTFLWDVLQLRTQMDRDLRGTVRQLSLECSGLVGMEATPKAIALGFPAGILDPTGYSTDPNNQIVTPRTAIWFNNYNGRQNSHGLSGIVGMTGVTSLRVAGMDTLYTFIPNSWTYEEDGEEAVRSVCNTSTGSQFKDNPMAIRYDDPVGAQGKVVWISAELYYMAQRNEADLRSLMAKLTEWIFED